MIKPYSQLRTSDRAASEPSRLPEPDTHGPSSREDEEHLRHLYERARKRPQERSDLLPYMRFIEKRIYGEPRSQWPRAVIYMSNHRTYRHELLYNDKERSIFYLQQHEGIDMYLKPRQDRLVRELGQEQPMMIPTSDGYGYTSGEYLSIVCYAAAVAYPEPRKVYALCHRKSYSSRDFVDSLYILTPEQSRRFCQKWVTITQKQQEAP